ncbi:MAG: ferritin-like domain-containing protein [Candidatus Thorarchaeota archaeon]|jgi:rubrerythrin
MRTSEQWWNDTKSNNDQLLGWLKDQYHGEVTAADRIEMLRDNFGASERNQRILTVIIGQERQHAEWIGELLTARGLTPQILQKTERYWEETLPGIEDFETGAAIGAHAETMRLERIRVIANDTEAPGDIRDTFTKILKDEEFHAQAFNEMTNREALEATREAHQGGLNALGLIA